MILNAQIIADSVGPHGVRLTTVQLTYPRFLHAEIMTYRVFARNAGSSRAIPSAKLIDEALTSPVLPLHVGLNQKGMGARQQITNPSERAAIKALIRFSAKTAAKMAKELSDNFKVTKQVVNRYLEPYTHIPVIVSATDFDNFFAQRCHPDAEPHIRALAWRFADLYYNSKPHPVDYGEWHLPYITDKDSGDTEDLKKMSAARCARVSYNLHDGLKPTKEKDLETYSKLIKGVASGDPLEPGHFSPLEHQATPLANPEETSGPFRGWQQFRKEFPQENMKFDYEESIKRGWRQEALEIFND